MQREMASISTLLLTVLVLRVASFTDQSDPSFFSSQPIGLQESGAGGRDVDTPEVVLQLKYDGGELNRIYLAQYRKAPKEWIPSVTARTNLCSDLCYAGLGGSSCGDTCQELVPVGLKAALQQDNNYNDSLLVGEPRTAVCPTLCNNNLGVPLCSCGPASPAPPRVDWTAVCGAFCLADRYVLGGCPACETMSLPGAVPASGDMDTVRVSPARILNSSDGWAAWCGLQCRQGKGGAACNCDRAPFQ